MHGATNTAEDCIPSVQLPVVGSLSHQSLYHINSLDEVSIFHARFACNLRTALSCAGPPRAGPRRTGQRWSRPLFLEHNQSTLAPRRTGSPTPQVRLVHSGTSSHKRHTFRFICHVPHCRFWPTPVDNNRLCATSITLYASGKRWLPSRTANPPCEFTLQ